MVEERSFQACARRARWVGRWLVVVLAWSAPAAAMAAFNCAQSVDYQSAWCAGSQITSIPQAEASRACAAFSKSLASRCRTDWDKFRSCDQFARRFEDLLLESCQGQKVSRKRCQSWSAAFAQGPLRRCERGRFTF
jgi:hypothetical protein